MINSSVLKLAIASYTHASGTLYYCMHLQWNLSIMDTLGPDIFGQLQYGGLPLSVVKNVLGTPVGTKILVLVMEVFSIVSLIRRVC